MNGVIGAARLLIDTDLTPEQREYAGMVSNSGESLLNIINDILDFSKIEAGKLAVESIPFDLRRVLREVEDLLTPRILDRPLTLRIEYPAGLPSDFLGDACRIKQVTLNLAGNAVKFTSAGEVAIRVSCQHSEGQTAHMRISVEDTGPGVPPEKLHLLFRKFSQLDASTSRKHGGTGLGLAISKQLVQMMGGAIGVSGHEGPGATFWFTLPLSLNPKTRAVNCRDRTAAIGAKFAALSAEVLVADDNVVNQKIAVHMLEKLGLRADVALNGRDAVRMSAGRNYDAVLMDCQMPEMDGYEAAREIRGQEGADRHVPIIAMTADAFSTCRHRCLSAGMDDYLSKPVRLERLSEALERWIPAGRPPVQREPR
jgi:CheY-like chemotaxis protein